MATNPEFPPRNGQEKIYTRAGQDAFRFDTTPTPAPQFHFMKANFMKASFEYQPQSGYVKKKRRARPCGALSSIIILW